jgi:hypothetical protein
MGSRIGTTMGRFSSRRGFLGASAATAAALAITPADANCRDARGVGLITAAGLIANSNRGPVDEKHDRFFVHNNLSFPSAYVIGVNELSGLPQLEVPVVTDSGPVLHRGPALASVLNIFGVKDNAIMLRLMALDGYAADLTLYDAAGQGWILAMGTERGAFAVGDRGPAYAVRPLPGDAKRSDQEDEKWVHSIFYIEVMA